MSDDSGNWQKLGRAEMKIFDPKGAPPSPQTRWRKEAPARDLFGLALSGGGIRSATFNLGLLQKLAGLKILEGFHYLSTVSGGGYLGGFWSAWQSRSSDREGRFPSAEGRQESDDIRHPQRLRLVTTIFKAVRAIFRRTPD